MVEPYNPEHVMRQFGLFQDIPTPLPRYLAEETHKKGNKGKGCFDWRAGYEQWIDLWNSEASTNIVQQNRPYDDTTTDAYKQWYRSSTHTLLTRPPPPRPTQLTREE